MIDTNELVARLMNTRIALTQCRSELIVLHHGDLDMEHATKHSAGLRMANAVLDSIAPKAPDAATAGKDEPEADLPRINRIERQMLQHGGVDSDDMEWMATMARTAVLSAAPAADGEAK